MRATLALNDLNKIMMIFSRVLTYSCLKKSANPSFLINFAFIEISLAFALIENS